MNVTSNQSAATARARALSISLTALMGLTLGGACSGSSKATDASSPVAAATTKSYPKAEVAVAVVASIPKVITVTGSIQPLDRSDVVPDISGKVIELMVDRGSKVAAGDPLLRLDTRAAVLSEREARANLAALKASQRLADETCRQSKALLEKGAITRAEYDRDAATCSQARESVTAASARLGRAGQMLADGLMRAPFAGTIAERWVSLGEWASPQGRLFTLVDESVLRAELSLSEAVSAFAKAGTEVDIVPIADRSVQIRGTISRVGLEIDPKTRTLRVEVKIPATANRDVLRAGMFVEGRIAVGELKLPAVPKTAVVKRGSTWHIFAVVGETLEERVVQLGPDAPGDRATIVRGLSAGEHFASTIDDKVRDGTRVE